MHDGAKEYAGEGGKDVKGCGVGTASWKGKGYSGCQCPHKGFFGGLKLWDKGRIRVLGKVARDLSASLVWASSALTVGISPGRRGGG